MHGIAASPACKTHLTSVDDEHRESCYKLPLGLFKKMYRTGMKLYSSTSSVLHDACLEASAAHQIKTQCSAVQPDCQKYLPVSGSLARLAYYLGRWLTSHQFNRMCLPGSDSACGQVHMCAPAAEQILSAAHMPTLHAAVQLIIAHIARIVLGLG